MSRFKLLVIAIVWIATYTAFKGFVVDPKTGGEHFRSAYVECYKDICALPAVIAYKYEKHLKPVGSEFRELLKQDISYYSIKKIVLPYYQFNGFIAFQFYNSLKSGYEDKYLKYKCFDPYEKLLLTPILLTLLMLALLLIYGFRLEKRFSKRQKVFFKLPLYLSLAISTFYGFSAKVHFADYVTGIIVLTYLSVAIFYVKIRNPIKLILWLIVFYSLFVGYYYFTIYLGINYLYILPIIGLYYLIKALPISEGNYKGSGVGVVPGYGSGSSSNYYEQQAKENERRAIEKSNGNYSGYHINDSNDFYYKNSIHYKGD